MIKQLRRGEAGLASENHPSLGHQESSWLAFFWNVSQTAVGLRIRLGRSRTNRFEENSMPTLS
ncbi:MAG: hypothetical protein V3T05_11000, partial [Myxococcota bacterium]